MRDQTLLNTLPLYAQIRRGELSDDEGFVVLLSLFGALVDQMAEDREDSGMERMKTAMQRLRGFRNCVSWHLGEGGLHLDEIKRIEETAPAGYPDMHEAEVRLRAILNVAK